MQEETQEVVPGGGGGPGGDQDSGPCLHHDPAVTRPVKTTGPAAADLGSTSEDGQDTDASSEVKQGRKLKILPYEFNREQEGELVEWYQANPEMYDKNCQQYRNKDRKNSLLDEGEGVPWHAPMPNSQLFKCQRTRYGKQSHSGNKSGSGGKNFTLRQQWIIDKWGFINAHIVRVASRQSTKKFDKKKPLPSISSEEEFDPLEGTSGSTTSTSQQHSKKSTGNSTGSYTPNATVVEERGNSAADQGAHATGNGGQGGQTGHDTAPDTT